MSFIGLEDHGGDDTDTSPRLESWDYDGRMALRRQLTRYPYSQTVMLSDLGWTDEQLASEAIISARNGIRALESLGLEPSDELRRRADGDPERVAAFVDSHRRSAGPENAVA